MTYAYLHSVIGSPDSVCRPHTIRHTIGLHVLLLYLGGPLSWLRVRASVVKVLSVVSTRGKIDVGGL